MMPISFETLITNGEIMTQPANASHKPASARLMTFGQDVFHKEYAMYGTANLGAGITHDDFIQRSSSDLYQQVFRRGEISRLLSWFTRHSNRLQNIVSVLCGRRVCSRHYIGIQPVAIRRIRASEGRSNDFDQSFRPLNSRDRTRWQDIARVRLYGKELPAVELIQIGDVYAVRDGHHRISVAKALGAEQIDAKVTVWEIE